MSTTIEPIKKVTPPPPDDPWYYGWRDTYEMLPDGTRNHVQIPLTLEDCLHPQEGDTILESSLHDQLTTYLTGVARLRVAHDPHALVLSDTGVYWDHPQLEHHSPDVCVIFGVKKRRINWTSFDVAEEGVWPNTIIELVSPNCRVNDVETKFAEYHVAEVPYYFIFDRVREDDPWSLYGYHWTPSGFLPLNGDAQGRLWCPALGIWLAAEGHNIVCYDGKTNERIGDFVENARRMQDAESLLQQSLTREQAEKQRAEAEKQRAEAEKQRAEAEKQRAEAEKQRAEAESQRADAEAKAREAAEETTRELQAQLSRLRNV